ncbi:MAG: microviridin/marinostatin family tricyclic proteinase inhibitor [Nannocystaceae bacterium]
MSKKINDQQADAGAVPFFAHLLSGDRDPLSAGTGGGGPAPTYHCLDSACTKKYPSDDDESTTWLGDRD